jgi:hypothetical protein
MNSNMNSIDAVMQSMQAQNYIAERGLATAIFLALKLKKPLFLEGEAGVGKTEVAKVLSRWTGGELVRLQCYEGIDASQAVYEWDYSRQLLHLRAVEASHERVDEDELYSERFLVKRPLLRALAHDGAEQRPHVERSLEVVAPVAIEDIVDAGQHPKALDELVAESNPPARLQLFSETEKVLPYLEAVLQKVRVETDAASAKRVTEVERRESSSWTSLWPL